MITDIDLSRIWSFHEEHGALATVALTPVENPLEFGIVITREDGSIDRFLEKPTWGQVFSDTINTGIYVFEPEIFDYIPDGRSVDFSSDVFPKLLADHRPLYGPVVEGYWEDVGTLDAYLRAHKDVLDERLQLDIPGFRIGDAVWLGEGAEVSPDAEVVGPVVIGPGSKIEAGCRLGQYTVLGSNVRLLADAQIERTVVHDNVYIGSNARIRGAVIGRSSSIRTNARIEEGTVLGDEVFVGADAVLAGDLKIYPFKTIEDGAFVNTSIVWESRGARSLFGRDGVSGLANVDITPELAAKLAMAYGTSLQEGHHDRHLARLEPGGADAEAGDHVGAQRGGDRRARPRGGERAGDEVPRPFASCARRCDGAARPQGPGPRARALLRQRRQRHLRGRPAQDGAAVPAGGLPPRAGGGDRRHPVPDPGDRGLHRRARRHGRP